MTIREDRLLSINYKIFTLQEVRKLVNPLWSTYQDFTTSSRKGAIKFHIKCFDRSAFSSEDISILNDDSIITQRRVKSINIDFNIDDIRMSKIKIEHGSIEDGDSFFSSSDIEIGGTDRDWVNAMVTKFQDIINSIPDQRNLIRRYNYLSFSLLVVAFFATTIGVIDWSRRDIENYVPILKRLVLNEVATDSIIGGVVGSVFCGGIIYMFVRNYSEKLYTATEMQIGPQHTFSEAINRKNIYGIYTLVIAPIFWILIKSFVKFS